MANVINRLELTDGDFMLLKGPLPNAESPCNSCVSHGVGCCGCSKDTEYHKRIAKFREANLLDLLKCLDNIDKNYREVEAITEKTRAEFTKMKNLLSESDYDRVLAITGLFEVED